MTWWWAKDERGEQLLTAQEIYAHMIQEKFDQRQILIEAIQQWTAGVSGNILPS